MDQDPYAPPEAQVSDVERDSGLPPGTRLYSPAQILGGAFFGGPLAAAWLFWLNYRAFGRDRSARQSLWIGVGATVALAALGMVLPENFPAIALPVAYSLGIHYYAKQIFARSFEQHLAQSGLKGSWWTVIGIAFASVLGVLAAVFTGSLLWFLATGR